MNPFDLTGPYFLLFYGLLGAASYLFLRVYVTHRERQSPIPKLKFNDPFEIAFLRGNKNETIRIASLSLIDRGLLEIWSTASSTPTLVTRYPGDINLGKSRIERALLRLFCARQEATAAFNDEECKRACDSYRNELGQHRLIRTSEIVLERLVSIGLIALLLLGVAAIKIYVAADRGRDNVVFLIILALFLMYLFIRLIWRHQTGLGDRVIADLKTLFQSLYLRRDSLRARQQTSDAALLAAVFGISSLPAAFQHIRDIFRKASKTGGSSCGSSCGSTGCGGGCGSGGGCGGCGS